MEETTSMIVGAGFDELRITSELLEVPPSKSRPDFGLIKVRTTAPNQNGEAPQISIGNLLARRRPG
jgi:acyl dehydratase